MKKENRFKVVFTDGSMLGNEGNRMIIVDTETGVNYLGWVNGYGCSITPLLDTDGKPIVTK